MAIKATQLYVEVKADTQHAEGGLKRVQQQAHGLGSGLGGIAKLAGGAFAALGAAKLVGVLFNGAKSAVMDFNAQLEQSAIAWETMLGSATAAEAMMVKLKRFAKETPFDFPELEQSSRRLLAMGFAADDVIPLMTDLGNAAAALGLGTAGVGRLTLALGQMNAKTKVSGNEMLQLTEAGVPAWNILANAMGKSVAETQKLVETGKIASDVFISAFRTYSQQNYGGLMEKQSRTFSGAMSNIKDSLQMGVAAMFQPLFAKLSEGAQRFATFLGSAQFDDFVAKVRAMVSGVIAGAEQLSARWNAYLESIHETTSAVSAGVQQAVNVLVGWFAEQLPKLKEIFETVLGGIQKFWTEHGARITAIVVSIWEFIQRHVRRVLSAVGEGINLALALVKGDWEGAWTSFKTILVAVWGGIIDYLATAAKAAISIIGGVYQALGKDDPTVGWAATIDGWANSLTQAASKALGVADTVGQAVGSAKKWTDYAAKGAEITDDWSLAWKNLGTEASRGMGGLRAAENTAVAGAAVTKAAIGSMGDTASGAANQMNDLVAALVRVHPASLAAAASVAQWEANIAGVNGALEANQRSQRGVQKQIAATQVRIEGLNGALTEAQERLDRLSNPRLTGMGQLEMQIGAIEAQINRLDLAKLSGASLGDIVAQYPLLTAGAEQYIATLGGMNGDALRELLQQLNLIHSLRYDEQLNMLSQMAEPVTAEISYEAAASGITATLAEIINLNRALATQEARLASQERALARLQETAESLNETLGAYQANLQAAQAAQDLVNKGLETAYTWFLQDRQVMKELGGEAVTQVGIIDAKARALLGATSTFATDTSTLTSTELEKMIAGLEESSANAVIAINLELDKIPTDIFTYHHIVTVYDSGGSVGGMASGGPAAAGMPYIVGEEGPELFVPDLSGVIVPNGARSRGAGAFGGGGNMAVTVHVHGTVISEKELATSVYDELQRLRRRNGSAGLA